MLLSRLQELIGGIYDVRVAHDVYDFLVTDRARLPPAARGGAADEELLVAQSADGSEVALSLYLDPQLLQRLAQADPLQSLHSGNVADCLTALEGVSHFLYLTWNAGHDKPVSLLELEMQAEVDKFIASHLLLRRQSPGVFRWNCATCCSSAPAPIRAWMRRALACTARPAAMRARFCRGSSSRLVRRRAARQQEGADRQVLAELRRFYRLSHARKRAHIERTS